MYKGIKKGKVKIVIYKKEFNCVKERESLIYR